MSDKNHLIDLTQYEESLKYQYKDDLGKIKIDKDKIDILYIGKAIQQSILRPFIEAIKETAHLNEKTVEVHTLYNSVAQGFNHGPFKKSEPFSSEELKKLYSKVTIVEYLGACEIDDINISGNYDVIFCCFEMQYATNWRFSLLRILRTMNEGGALYFSELGGDIRIMDGHFGDLSVEVTPVLGKFLNFKNKRNEIFYWNPEISITNYKKMERFLWIMFNHVRSNELKGDNTIPLTAINILKNHKDSFTFLSHGMKKDESESLIASCFDIGKTDLKHSFVLYSAIGHKSKNFEKRFSIRESNSLAESIRTINDYSLNSIGKKFLHLCEQHDLLFTKPNAYYHPGIFIPNDIDSVINGKLITKNKTIEIPPGSYPSKTLFVNMHIDVPVLIIYLKDYDSGMPENIHWIKDELKKDIKEIGLKVKRNRNGELAYINFYFKKERHTSDIERDKLYAIKNKLFNYYENVITESLSVASLEDLLLDVEKYHFWRKDLTQSNIITYFPASIKSKKESPYNADANDNSKIISQHIGCIFIKENWHNNDKILLNPLIDARNDILSRMADYILHRLNLVHSIDNYKRFARRAAIAAISARNVSHNIGSHVIPAIKKKRHGKMLREITNTGRFLAGTRDYIKGKIQSEINPSVNSFYHYDTFLEYVSQRNDFVNQLTSTNTSWSISVWFVRELMAKFMNQFFLLNSLGEHEGLKIYNFEKNIKSSNKTDLPEGCYRDYPKNFKENEDAEKVMIYGNISIDSGKLKVLLNDEKVTIKVCDQTWKDNRTKFDELLKILKHQDKRKFRLRGSIKYYSNAEESYLLKNGAFVSNNIIIKVRLRKYAQIEGDKWSDVYDYSKYLGVTSLFDLRSNKYDHRDIVDAIKESNNTYYYGIIKSINTPCTEIEISLWKKSCWLVFSNILPKDDHVLKPGARIIFSSSNFSADSITFTNVVLHEISFTQHLLTTSPENTYEDIVSNDIKVSIPGGISGYQSFYTILENVIRNSVKHNWVHLPPEEKIGRNLELKIDLSRIKGISHYIIKVWTNLTDLRYMDALVKYDKNHKKSDPKQLPTEALTKKLNNIFKSDIIKDNTGDFVRSDLGSTETKINAAYLYNSNFELTSDTIMKENVLLDDKTLGDIEKGYIKASRIYEYYSGEIIPKLGIRFKIKKPVELSIYTFDSDLIGIIDEDDAIQLITEDNLKEPSTIQGDICLLDSNIAATPYTFFAEDSLLLKEVKRINLPELINIIISLPGDSSTVQVDQILTEFTIKIEQYPYRLMYTYNKANLISNLKAKFYGIYLKDKNYNEKSHALKITDALRNMPDTMLRLEGLTLSTTQLKKLSRDLSLFNFFTRRVYFVNLDEIKSQSKLSIDNGKLFDNLNGKPEKSDKSEKLKLVLYDKWISRHVIKDLNVNTQVYLSNPNSNNQGNDEIIRSPSQYPDINNICDSILDSITYPIDKQEEKNHISYTRHGHNEKHAYDHYIYCESLSGEKLSYNLFSIFSSDDNYNKLKLRLRLKENALLKYLILDERLMKYLADSDKEVIKRFHSMGIAIPHSFRCSSEENPKVNLNYGKEVKAKLDNKYIKAADSVITFDDMVIEYLLVYNAKVEHRVINTIIIHQSILEKIVEDISDKKGEEMDKIILSFKKRFPSVIITSGRNKTASKISARFLPFSVIEELLYSDNPDKINFTETILKTNL